MAMWMIRIKDLRVRPLSGPDIFAVLRIALGRHRVSVTGSAAPVVNLRHRETQPSEWCLVLDDKQNREQSIIDLMLGDLLPRHRAQLLNIQPYVAAARSAPRRARLRVAPDPWAPAEPAPQVERPRRVANNPYGTISGTAPYAGES